MRHVLRYLKSIEIHIFFFHWQLNGRRLTHYTMNVYCPRSSCVQKNKHALKTSRDCRALLPWRLLFLFGETTFQCMKKIQRALLQVPTMKWPLHWNMQMQKPFKRWVGRIWSCSNWINCTEGWKWLILLARSFVSLANQQTFVALFPGCKLHQILMVGRVGIYIILFQTIWTPQDTFKKMTESYSNIIGFLFQAVPGLTKAFSIQITSE